MDLRVIARDPDIPSRSFVAVISRHATQGALRDKSPFGRRPSWPPTAAAGAHPPRLAFQASRFTFSTHPQTLLLLLFASACALFAQQSPASSRVH